MRSPRSFSWLSWSRWICASSRRRSPPSAAHRRAHGARPAYIDDRAWMNALPLLFLLAFLVSVDLRIIAPVLPSISESLRATAGAIGLAMTSYSFAYGAGQLAYGPPPH